MNMNQWAEILNNQIEFPYMYKLNIESPSGPKKKKNIDQSPFSRVHVIEITPIIYKLKVQKLSSSKVALVNYVF